VQRVGPLEGLGRFAARAAAIEQLTTEGHVSAHFESIEAVRRCHRCSTIVVPMYGVHWLLSLDALIPPLLEALDRGAAEASPAVLERLRETAQNVGSWCISQQLWSGERIPVSTCLDCGQTTVAVEDEASCGACMGTLQHHADILDARFIAAIVPIAMLGWPAESGDERVTLCVGRSGLERWVLPIAALGLRLAGRVPFDCLLVHQLPVGVPDDGALRTGDLIDRVGQVGTSGARTMLLLGDPDDDRATALLRDLDEPAAGEIHVQDLVADFDDAIHHLNPGEALIALQAAAREGLDEPSRAEIRHLIEPLLAE
jgi:valyl-tRNA synthetase